jgi:hypothetical protein
MKLKKLFRYYFFGESIKEIEMNRILEKISKKTKLSEREKNFLELYNFSNDDDKDLMYLSKNTTFKKIKDFISRGKKVICDLHDRDGKIGLEIKDATNNIEEEDCIIILKDNTTHKLHDKFLYNLIYNVKKNHYSLQEQDEYYEKIEAKK